MAWLKAQWQSLQNRPDVSWQRFKRGVMFFVASVLLLFAGAHYWIWLQILGLICLVIGLGYAAIGYIGILAYRLTLLKQKPFRNKQ